MERQIIPYGRQWIDEADIEAVIEVLTSDYLTTGPKIEEFEKVFAKYVGAEYAVAISNGTAALHAACYAAGIKEGDEVITTPITFAASANCVRYCGGKPVFADIDPQTYNIDPKDIRRKVTSKTKAIIAVDYTGQPCELDAIYEIAKEYDLIVIEDAAHSLGASYKGQKVGSIADMTTFSFHPVKHITTGEGGMITTNNKDFYEKLLLFRAHGITRDVDKLYNKEEGPWYYEQVQLGYNYRMSDIQCALGISQLKKVDTFVRRRKEIVQMYNKAFEKINQIVIPYQFACGDSSWHLYVIKLKLDKLTATRKEIFETLKEQGLGVNVHYIPVYYFPYYQQLGYKRQVCIEAEKLYEEIITLPLFPKMSDEEVQQVIITVNQVINHYRK